MDKVKAKEAQGAVKGFWEEMKTGMKKMTTTGGGLATTVRPRIPTMGLGLRQLLLGEDSCMH